MSNVKRIEEIITSLEEKNFNIYFFTIDTKGNPTAGVANVYEHVKLLGELGYNAHILQEKEDYTGVEGWLGEEYSSLSHRLTKDLTVEPSDIIVVPEVYANVMEQLAKYPCKKVVLSQSYSYIFELLNIGKSWHYDFKFNDVITTTNAQAEYISRHFPNINTHVVAPSIPAYFNKPEGLKIPVIGIMTREQKDVLNIIKSFYLQYPMYKWVTFKDLRGIPREQFAEELKSHCLSVWVDDSSSFGTFPLESMQCGTPVIGKIPDMVPEWMVTPATEEKGVALKDNGVWTDNILNIPNLIAEFMRLWLEDSVPQVILDEMDNTGNTYTVEAQKKQMEEVYGSFVAERIKEYNNALEIEKAKEEKDEQ
jgi:glycosyltransferase involved in cell wall biosynthesis